MRLPRCRPPVLPPERLIRTSPRDCGARRDGPQPHLPRVLPVAVGKCAAHGPPSCPCLPPPVVASMRLPTVKFCWWCLVTSQGHLHV